MKNSTIFVYLFLILPFVYLLLYILIIILKNKTFKTQFVEITKNKIVLPKKCKYSKTEILSKDISLIKFNSYRANLYEYSFSERYNLDFVIIYLKNGEKYKLKNNNINLVNFDNALEELRYEKVILI